MVRAVERTGNAALLAAALAFLMLGGCGDSNSTAKVGGGGPGPKPSRTSGAVVKVTPGVDADAQTGVIVGAVRFEGQAPRRLPIAPIASSAGCAEHESPPLVESYIIQDGHVANVVVSVRRTPKGYAAPPPAQDPFVLDQRGCLYVPHVFALQTGRPMIVANSDQTSHNVHVVAKLNRAPNKTIGAGGSPLAFTFEKAELVRFICDIHPWMGAYLSVFKHPFFAVTGDDGTFRVEGLPPGEYVFEAWHEKLGKLRTKQFTLGAGDEARVGFTYER